MEPKTTIVLGSLFTGALLLLLSSNYSSKVEFVSEGWRREGARKHTGQTSLLKGSKVDINEFLVGVIENFREDMTTGIPELKIPVLDPLRSEKPFNIDVEDEKASVHGNFTDVQVEGMSGFVMESLHADLKNLSVDFHLRLPWIKGSGNYIVEGKLIKIVPLRGNGEFWVESFNLTLKAKASLETSEDNHLQLSKDFDVQIDFDKVELYLENFLGGGRWTEILLKILNNMSKDVLKKLLPQIKGELNKSLLKVINKQLMKLPITSIIPGSNANEYVDQILENVQKYVKDHNLDPMKLPDFAKQFSKEVIYVNVSGEAKLHDGWLSGISSLHRADECQLNTTKTTIAVSAHLGLNGLDLSYKGHAQFLSLGPSIEVGGSVDTVEFFFRIRQSNKKGATPVVEEFVITELSTIWIEIDGLGTFSWLLKWLLTGVSKLMEDFIVIKVSNQVRQAMEAEFQKLSFPV